ncbi:MAG: putative transglutaminase-like cysteine proteinase [Gammaproteobacteria bacterium]
MIALWLTVAAAAASFGIGDALVIRIAGQYGADARARVLAWEALILNHANEPTHTKLELVNAFFNKLRFLDDIDHWGRRDYWATPVEFLSTSGGDCEDFSIAKYFTLKELGVPVERLRLTYVKALELGQAHMVLAYYATPDAEPLILDNLVPSIEAGSSRTDLQPVYSFNGDGLWMAVARGRGRRVGTASRLNLWRDLTTRMEREDVWSS